MPRRSRRSLVVRLARAPRAGAAVVRRRRVARFEQLGLDFELAPPRWSFSRLVLRSRHFERIRERIAAHRFLADDGLDIHLTASVGVATLPDAAASAEELVQAADKAMYHVKDSGKNGIHLAAAPADN